MSGSKLFHLNEDQLLELERVLPELMQDMAFMTMPMDQQPGMLPRHRVQWTSVMNTITAIRWNGGPPLEVGIVPAGPRGDD